MLKPYLKNYYILQISSVASKLSKIFSASLLKPPFYRVAKVTVPIIMTKTFCKILTNFIVLFLRTSCLFISGLQRYTLSTHLPNLFVAYLKNFLSKNCPLFYRRVAKVRGW
jgi:hypothetical protein